MMQPAKIEDLLYIPPEMRLDTPERIAAQKARLAKRPIENLKSVLYSDNANRKLTTALKPLWTAAGRLAQEVAEYVRHRAGLKSNEIAEHLGWHPAGAAGALSLALKHGLVCRTEDGSWWHVDHLAKATWDLLEGRKGK